MKIEIQSLETYHSVNYEFKEIFLGNSENLHLLEKKILENISFVNREKTLSFLENMKRTNSNKRYIEISSIRVAIQYKILPNELRFVGLLIFRHIPRKFGETQTEWINCIWMIDPKELPILIKNFQKSFFSSFFSKIILSYRSNISYIFWEFPESSLLQDFYQKNKNPLSTNLSVYLYPYNEKFIQKDSNRIYYRCTYGFIWSNPKFNPLNVPSDIVFLWEKANALYCHFKNGIDLDSPIMANKWNIILRRKKFHKKKAMIIQKKLEKIKFCFKKNFSDPNFFQMIISIMKEIGLTFQILKIPINNPSNRQLLKDFQLDLIINIIESIPTQGSLFTKIIKKNGEINPDLFEISFLEKIFGNYAVLLFLKIDNEDQICLGYSNAFLKKDPEYHSRQIFNGIIIGEQFRGYSLGKIFAYVGARVGSKYCDIFYEDSTVLNKGTLKMISPLKFIDFGILKNFKFYYNPEKSKFQSVDLNRKYWINPDFYRKIKKQKRIQLKNID
ncbi:hypothetical protein [Candidatus Harpocratesius sp.]